MQPNSTPTSSGQIADPQSGRRGWGGGVRKRSIGNLFCHLKELWQWRIQYFPVEGALTPKGGHQPIIWPIFPENYMKMKKFWARGGREIRHCLESWRIFPGYGERYSPTLPPPLIRYWMCEMLVPQFPSVLERFHCTGPTEVLEVGMSAVHWRSDPGCLNEPSEGMNYKLAAHLSVCRYKLACYLPSLAVDKKHFKVSLITLPVTSRCRHMLKRISVVLLPLRWKKLKKNNSNGLPLWW